jgi:predicted HicB family RNase H-like nuclease
MNDFNELDFLEHCYKFGINPEKPGAKKQYLRVQEIKAEMIKKMNLQPNQTNQTEDK